MQIYFQQIYETFVGNGQKIGDIFKCFVFFRKNEVGTFLIGKNSLYLQFNFNHTYTMDYYDNNQNQAQRMMRPVEAVKTCFSKYFDFQGRAQRSEFWWWLLFLYIVNFIIGLFGPSQAEVMAAGSDFEGLFEVISENSGYYIISQFVQLALLIPSLAVWSRRLHDGGFSAWWLLLWFTCVGVVALIVMACLPSQQFPNRYGNVPGTPDGYGY